MNPQAAGAMAGTATSSVTTTHRRRQPNMTERARRVAWGKEWGAITRAAGQKARERL